MLKKAQVDDLRDLIETLKNRIRDHGAGLARSEMETRNVLVDQLLSKLGWDMGNPDHVKREHNVGIGNVDYALFKDGKESSVLLVEAKKLSTHTTGQKVLPGVPETEKLPKILRDAAIQGLGYCLATEVRYVAVTDGRRWDIYDVCREGFLDGKRIAFFDLMADSAVADCLRATVLWRLDVERGDKGKKPPVQPPKKQTREFAHGMRVDAAGYVLGSSGKRDKRYGRRPRGTKWVVGGHSLDAAGYVLDSTGKRDKQHKQPYPPNTMYIVDRRPLDKDRWVLTFDGKRDQDFKIPCPDETKRIVDGFFLDAYRWRLTKDGDQNESFKQPYPLGGKRSVGSKRANSMGRRRRGGF